MSGERGIVLDTAELVAKVPAGARLVPEDDGRPDAILYAWVASDPGDVEEGATLTHIAGRPVAELVALADQAEGQARVLRTMASGVRPWAGAAHPDPWKQAQADGLDAAADFLDRLRAALIDLSLIHI